MYEDNPHWRIFSICYSRFISTIRCAKISPAKTVESIAQITPDLLYQCYRCFLSPRNMALFVVGDLDPDRVWQQVEENIARRNYKEAWVEIIRLYPDEPEAVLRQRTTREMVVFGAALQSRF